MVSRDHKSSLCKQCELLQLSRSRLYYQPVGESAENLRFMETPWYGSRQMARYIKRDNHQCGRHRVRRLMRLMRLVPVYQEPTTSKKHPQHKIWPYLRRNALIDYPNQVWCADITYIPMRHGFLYLVAIRCAAVVCLQTMRAMDWHSRKVLAWRLSNSMGADFCVEALKEARAKHGKPEIFNTPSRALLRNTLPGSGSRQPVYQWRVDRRADGCEDQDQDQHAWQRRMARQSDD